MNRCFASSACFCASRGRTKTFGTKFYVISAIFRYWNDLFLGVPDSMATTDKISLEHLYLGLEMSILASCGSRGNSAIMAPTCKNNISKCGRGRGGRWEGEEGGK